MAVHRVKRLGSDAGNQTISMGCISGCDARRNMWIAGPDIEKLTPAQLLGL